MILLTCKIQRSVSFFGSSHLPPRDEDANSGQTGAVFAYAAVVAVSIFAVYFSRPK
jgi:hypothetical protein